MDFTAYNRSTGEVLYRGSADAPELLETDTVAILVGVKHDADGWIDGGVFHPLPTRPSREHVFDYVTKQWVDPRTPETQWEAVRMRRNALLAQSDWTQLPDVPLATKEAWATYRQALRDITEQPDPFDIVWPTPPGA